LKVLITGGCGFIGSHLADHLSSTTQIKILDDLSRIHTFKEKISKGVDPYTTLKYLRTKPNIEIVKGDVCQRDIVLRAAKDIDLIIHAAAQTAVTESLKDPLRDFKVNALGTVNILEAARVNDAIVEFCSTNKVYGENINRIPLQEEETRYRIADTKYCEGIPEHFPIDQTSHSPYGCSKLAADLYVQEYAYTYGLKTAVFRLSCIYGPRQLGVEDQGWITWLTTATLTGTPINIYGNGKQVRDTLYITDLVDAFKRYAETPSNHEIFNLGGGPHNTLSVLDLLKLLQEFTGKRSTVHFKSWRPADQKLYISDIRRIKETLGWHPTISPRQGLKQLIHWLQQSLPKKT
jgi:CDP-paratose 2-epimerase